MPIIKVPANEVKTGMVLAQPLTDAQGRIILGEDGRLSPIHIKRLERWGITELLINTEADQEKEQKAQAKDKSSDNENRPALDEEYMKEMAIVFKTRFLAVEGNPLMDHIKKVAFKRIVLEGRNNIPGVY